MVSTNARKWPHMRVMVAGSNRSVAYSIEPVMPSACSIIDSIRSNFELPRSDLTWVMVRPAGVRSAGGRFCSTNMTWNSGV